MIDQKIAKIHNIASIKECDGLNLLFTCADHWTCKIECSHGKISEASQGPADLETAVGKLLVKFREEHGIAAKSKTH